MALRRISKYLIAEELVEPYSVEPESEYAVDVEGDFVWETSHGPKTAGKDQKGVTKGDSSKSAGSQKKHKRKRGSNGDKKDSILLTVSPVDEKVEDAEDKPFELKDLRFKVHKGAFVAIVGSVGSGKVSTSITLFICKVLY